MKEGFPADSYKTKFYVSIKQERRQDFKSKVHLKSTLIFFGCLL